MLETYVNGIQHVGVPTNDLEKTVAFYKSLGFTVALDVDNRGERVCFLTMKNLCIETYENHQAVGRSGAIDHIALDVNDVDAVLAAVQAAGHSPLEGAVQFLPFWEKGVRYFTILGPNMEKVEFSQRL